MIKQRKRFVLGGRGKKINDGTLDARVVLLAGDKVGLVFNRRPVGSKDLCGLKPSEIRRGRINNINTTETRRKGNRVFSMIVVPTEVAIALKELLNEQFP